MASSRLSDPGTVRRALLTFGLFRIESALVVALTLVLGASSALGADWAPGRWWAWLLFGVVGEIAIMTTTLTDRGLRRLLEQRFQERFGPTRLHDPGLRRAVDEALEYRRLIADEVANRQGAPGPQLGGLLPELEDWLARTYLLAEHLDSYHRHPVLSREETTVPGEIDSLKERLANERDPAVHAQLSEACHAKAQQWEALRELRTTLKRATLQLDATLSAMGTVYTRLVNLRTKVLDVQQARDLQRFLTMSDS